jgi:hypothetical protein
MEELKNYQNEMLELQHKICSLNDERMKILKNLKGKCFYHKLQSSDTIQYMYRIEGSHSSGTYGTILCHNGIKFMQTINEDINDKEIPYEDFKKFAYLILEDKFNRN